VADAVVLDEDQISILFSFAHSYFQVDIEQTHALVDFLKELLPKKRRAELYISLGYNKHGKTELYRDLLAHFAEIRAHEDMDRFERAPGQRGMVMIVFTMGTYNMVFKLIKDRFDYPKQTTRAGVMDRYHLVFRHDRAGRLVDAQEFEHLELSRDLFTDELLRELRDVASNTVHVTDDTVTIDHTYVERRVTPLDLYLRHEPFGKARAAILDYGQAIRDLARTNIFPGDLLLKNFGVTRHGRVVFYDYDELCFVTDCTYRTKPKAQTYEQEMASDAWFYVGPDDVFPEEFVPTLGLSDDLERVLLEHHAEVFTAAFWNETKARLEDGEILPILPYPDRYRLPPRHDVMPQG
jgi:isocitrate dehydrogenase kinase/phosphatase